MQKTKTKLQALGFNLNHIALIGVAVLIFAILILPQTNFSPRALFANAEKETEIITYEQVRDQVYADSGVNDEQKYITDLENQFALLDRGEVDGKVLGEVIGIGEISSVDQLYSEEQLALIPISNQVTSTKQSVQSYADQLLKTESYYDTAQMFANLNGSNNELMKKTSEDVEGLVTDMSNMTVPTELVTFHKYTVLYYQVLGKIAGSFQNNDEKLSEYSTALFSLMDKLSSLKAEVNSTYGVQL